MKKKFDLNEEQIDRIIEMAWEDRTPFDAITDQFGLKEQDVIELMRKEMKRSKGVCLEMKLFLPEHIVFSIRLRDCILIRMFLLPI